MMGEPIRHRPDRAPGIMRRSTPLKQGPDLSWEAERGDIMSTTRSLGLASLLVGVCAAGATASGQQADAPKAKSERPAEGAPGRRAFTPPIVSPEVHGDRSVTFRLRAPNAMEIKVS